MNKTKKILIVTHQYTPHLSPRTTRWKSIVDELVNMGHDVMIVTGTQQNDLNQDKNIIYVGNKSSNNFVNNVTSYMGRERKAYSYHDVIIYI